MIETRHLDGYSVISGVDGIVAAVVRGKNVGPLFRNRTDAVDWAEDTNFGAKKIPDYEVRPMQGALAHLALLLLAEEYFERRP